VVFQNDVFNERDCNERGVPDYSNLGRANAPGNVF